LSQNQSGTVCAASSSVVRSPVHLRLAVALLSAAGLRFELTLTRIFSATIWYHYTFVAISVALFGWGLGGFTVHLLGLARAPAQVQRILVLLSLLLAVMLPVFLVCILRRPFTPDRLNLYFSLSLLPFLIGGAALSLAFEAWGKDANRLYFADLLGAAGGVLLAPVALRLLGAESTVLATAVLPALAAVLISLGRARATWKGISTIAVAAAVGLTVWNCRTDKLAIYDAPGKGLYRVLREYPDARITSDRWNAYSRITSVGGFEGSRLARLYIDSDAWTDVLHWDGTPGSPHDARNWFRSLAFRLKAEPKVLVIGPGGGTDVIMAVCAGSPQVTAVEMNPLIVDCVRSLGGQAGSLYDHPNVRLVQQEGRNFIERSPERFDLIVLGFVDSWAAVASGGLSLTESYLYTREALEAYYDHLTEGGALVIIRWPVDVRRLVANSFDLLSGRGLSPSEIGRRVLAVSSSAPQGNKPVETVFMLCRSPLAPEQVDALLAGHEQAHLISSPWPLGGPGSPDGVPTSRSATQADSAGASRPAASAPQFVGDPPYVRLFSGRIPLSEFGQSFETLATPVSDGRPFYFATDKPNGIPGFVLHLLRAPALWLALFVVLLLAGSWLRGLRPPGPRAWGYFGALGMGFMICEITLLQRFILLLGHPIYTLVVLLFTLLLGGALGSLTGRRIAPQKVRPALVWIILGVMGLLLVAAFGLPQIIRAALPLSLSLRVLLAAALVFPFGFLMGMPFPLGLRRYAETPGAAPISALWGINGAASVVGSISGTLLAVVYGFTAVLLIGTACYALALLTRPK